MADTFAARLRLVRERRGMKRTVLAELAGLDRNAITHYEEGRRLPNAAALSSLAVVLEVSADYLLGLEENF